MSSLDVHAVREHFSFSDLGRIPTNNAASTQPPRELVALYQSLAPGYENVHRGQSTASRRMTALFEQSYDTIAQFIGAPGRQCIAVYRNTTEAINAVMYSLLTEFRDGDNVVTKLMEHKSTSRTRLVRRGPPRPLPAWLHSGGMAGPFFDAAERAQLADLLDELGPDAATLLPPWTTRDIAAHLVLRERDPLAGPGLVLPGPWSRLAQRRQAALATRDFTRLVATLRAGPPPGFFRTGWVRRVPNLNEFFVHHEDVRRANGRGSRANEQAMEEALWCNVCRGSWYLARRLRGTGLKIQWAGTVRTVRVRRGEPTARIAGPPGELLLYLFGRPDAAQVEVSGPAAAVQAVRRAHFGL